MKYKQLPRLERRTSIRPAFAVAEFDLEYTWSKIFDYRAYLSADKLLSRHIFQESHNIEEFGVHMQNYLKERNNWSAWESFLLSVRSRSFEPSPFPTDLPAKSLTRTFGRRHHLCRGLLPPQQPP